MVGVAQDDDGFTGAGERHVQPVLVEEEICPAPATGHEKEDEFGLSTLHGVDGRDLDGVGNAIAESSTKRQCVTESPLSCVWTDDERFREGWPRTTNQFEDEVEEDVGLVVVSLGAPRGPLVADRSRPR